MSNYLAFDLGASSGRGIVGSIKDAKLTLSEIHRFANGPVEREGSLYWDYDRLCAEIKEGVRKALATGMKIDGIAIDTWGVDYLLFDVGTRAIKRPPYNYRDERTAKAVERVKSILPLSEVYRATGIQHMALNTIFQLVAHKMDHPEDFENAVFLPIPDALALTLGGDFTAEYTHVSTMGLLDPATRDWAWPLIDKLELPRSIFPKIVPPCAKGGVLSPELQREFHAPAIPIYKIGSHDTASAVAAVPAPLQGDWAYLSAGTWALLGAEIPAPLVTGEAAKYSFTNEGGLDNTIRFLTNIMGSWLFQETRRNWNEAGRNISFMEMEKMAKSAAPGRFFINPNDALFAPPGDMPQRIRDYVSRSGQGTIGSDAELLRTIYDSLALYFRTKLDLLGTLLGKKYSAFNIVGGGTKDRLLMQLTADALNIPVIAGPVEATAVGNILAQAIGAGEYRDLAAARQLVRDSFDPAEYRPDPAMHELYMKLLPEFSRLAR